jgi:sulfopyruvate decarboxylase alpha subunit
VGITFYPDEPSAAEEPDTAESAWPLALYGALKKAGIRQASYVPDAGHARLIELFEADTEVQTTVLTSEEEGVALAAGAWLGGQRSVLLMQSSGVGNCINMLSLMASCRFPLLTIVTMRGEWAEFNPWQVPMARATEPALTAIGVKTTRVEAAKDVADVARAAAALAFDADQQIAVLLAQRMLGHKIWVGK